MDENEKDYANMHLSLEDIESNLYRFPWYKPWYNKKLTKIELRCLEDIEGDEQ